MREDWEERRRLEGQLLRRQAVFDSVAETEALYAEFGCHLEEAEPDLDRSRAEHIAALQARLATVGGRRPGGCS